MSLRDVNQISIERDISETSQKHLKRDVFFVTSQIHFKKDVFFVTSLGRLEHISETSQKHLSQVFLFFQKYVTKMISCDFCRLITISDKIDVAPSETLRK